MRLRHLTPALLLLLTACARSPSTPAGTSEPEPLPATPAATTEVVPTALPPSPLPVAFLPATPTPAYGGQSPACGQIAQPITDLIAGLARVDADEQRGDYADYGPSGPLTRGFGILAKEFDTISGGMADPDTVQARTVVVTLAQAAADLSQLFAGSAAPADEYASDRQNVTNYVGLLWQYCIASDAPRTIFPTDAPGGG